MKAGRVTMGPGIALALAGSLILPILALVFFAQRTVAEWRQATEQSINRRASEVLLLLATALEQDMSGVQRSVLLPINEHLLMLDPPHDLLERFSRAFARFPYPESFFAWRSSDEPSGVTYFFNRLDRHAPWDHEVRPEEPYPVVTLRDPEAVRAIVTTARRLGAHGTTFVTFESDVGGVRYQCVVHLLYSGESGEIFGLTGFTVNLDWAAREYVPRVVAEVQRIGGRATDTSVEVSDHRAQIVTRLGPPLTGPVHARTFPLSFVDRALWSALPAPRPEPRIWTVRVSAANDPAYIAAARGQDLALALVTITAIVLAAGLIATTRAVRADAVSAARRANFVSTIAHEMKTPLAVIRLVADTLSQKRYAAPEKVTEYAALLGKEAARLTGVIDNLLTFVRVEEARAPYSPEPVQLVDLIDESIEHADMRLVAAGFDVTVDVGPHLPRIVVDRAAMIQVIDNLVDNALKFSGKGAILRIRGRAEARTVVLTVEDNGIGIPRDELPRVFDRFFRSRTAVPSGSGLGLTIAKRIVEDHSGRIAVDSAPGLGLTVTITLPSEETS
jgi:signal transduction histidine kinase